MGENLTKFELTSLFSGSIEAANLPTQDMSSRSHQSLHK